MVYRLPLVKFDGTGTLLSRSSNLLGMHNSEQGMFSCWLRTTGGDGTARDIIDSATSDLNIFVATSDNLKSQVGSAPAATGFRQYQNFWDVQLTSSNIGITHILLWWDSDFTHLYVNDVPVNRLSATWQDKGPLYAMEDSDWYIGGDGSGANFAGALGGLYLNTDIALDLTVETNRRKFISADGLPVDLGPNGERPTDAQPILCMDGALADWNAGKNFGYGGDFTVSGTISDFSLWPPPIDDESIRVFGRELTSAIQREEQTTVILESP